MVSINMHIMFTKSKINTFSILSMLVLGLVPYSSEAVATDNPFLDLIVDDSSAKKEAQTEKVKENIKVEDILEQSAQEAASANTLEEVTEEVDNIENITTEPLAELEEETEIDLPQEEAIYDSSIITQEVEKAEEQTIKISEQELEKLKELDFNSNKEASLVNKSQIVTTPSQLDEETSGLLDINPIRYFQEQIDTAFDDDSVITEALNEIGDIKNDSNSTELLNDASENVSNKSKKKDNDNAENFYLSDKFLTVTDVKKSRKDDFNLLAFEAINSQQYEAAIYYYNKILENKADDIKALLGLAISYNKLDDYNNAKEYALEILDIDENNVAATKALINSIKSQEKDTSQVILSLKKYSEIYSKNNMITHMIGDLYNEKQDYNNASIYYYKAFSRDRNNQDILFKLAVNLEKIEELSSARQVYLQLYEMSARDGTSVSRSNYYRNKIYSLSN